jgi:hypothetical protein
MGLSTATPMPIRRVWWLTTGRVLRAQMSLNTSSHSSARSLREFAGLHCPESFAMGLLVLATKRLDGGLPIDPAR